MMKLPLDRLLTYKDKFESLKVLVFDGDIEATVERKEGNEEYTIVIVENGVRYPHVHSLKEAYDVIKQLLKILEEPKLA